MADSDFEILDGKFLTRIKTEQRTTRCSRRSTKSGYARARRACELRRQPLDWLWARTQTLCSNYRRAP
jgi:hypothetical protein